MLRKVFQFMIPPVVFAVMAKLSERFERPDKLFDGEDKLFKSQALRASVYGEYGCGKSTVWMGEHTDCVIISVDTDKNWANRISELLGKRTEYSEVSWVDVGEVGRWGYPLSYDSADNFNQYICGVWSKVYKPDLVLIDGRFRVCCFLTSLKYGKKGTRILFDDYVNRRQYHFVENYLEVAKIYGRQALFVIPEKETLDLSHLERDIERFKYVLD